MQTTWQSEKGMALVMALSAIVVIGVMMAGVVFVTTQDYRIGANTVRTARAAAAAELGLNGVLVDWKLADNSQLQTGATLTKSYTAPRGATANVIVTRLPGPFFWVVSEGYAGGLGSQGSGRRRYGTLFRLDTPAVNFMGALTTQGQLRVTGTVNVNGMDAAPPGWSGCSGTQNVAGAAISPTTTYDVSGAKVKVTGMPVLLTTPAAGDSNTYFNYGNSNYQALAAAANLIYHGEHVLTGVGPIAVGGVCQPSLIPANWGDPNRASPAGACESYFPIIHADGNLKATTGRGQGVLLVDGDFTIAGNFEFTGVVIVRGGLKMTGTGNKITGGVMAAQVTVDDDAVLAGNTSINYSSCAVMSALSANAYPKQARERGWVDVY
jgi:cytoskeletal protein CcmA (bactofilin family)